MTIWIVTQDKDNQSRGILTGPDFRADCALGKNGSVDAQDKTEGDAKTPLGIYPFRRLYYRSDRITKPCCFLPSIIIERDMGWCDDTDDPAYNLPVILPYKASAESLFRDNNVYNIIVIIGHNDDPAIKDKGSAIFIHIARDDFSFTMGCIALKYNDLIDLLAIIKEDDLIEIRSCGKRLH